jgi:hypothetical protein
VANRGGVQLAKPIVIKPLTADLLQRIRHRAMSFKILVVTEADETHVLLTFEDLGSAYHVKTIEELDRIIDGLQNIRDQVRMGSLRERVAKGRN